MTVATASSSGSDGVLVGSTTRTAATHRSGSAPVTTVVADELERDEEPELEEELELDEVLDEELMLDDAPDDPVSPHP